MHVCMYVCYVHVGGRCLQICRSTIYKSACMYTHACVWGPESDTEFRETEFFLNPELINWTCHIGSLLWRMPVSHRVRL